MILTFLREAFRRRYPTLSEELELKHGQMSHVNDHDEMFTDGNNKCEEYYDAQGSGLLSESFSHQKELHDSRLTKQNANKSVQSFLATSKFGAIAKIHEKLEHCFH